MKISEFRKLIREEVRKVVREADFKVVSIVKLYGKEKSKILGIYPNIKIASANYKNDVPNSKYNSDIDSLLKGFKPNEKCYLVQSANGRVSMWTEYDFNAFAGANKKSSAGVKPNPKDFVLIQDEDGNTSMSKSARDLKDSYQLIGSEGEEVTKFASWNDAKKQILEDAPDLKKYFKTVDALPAGTYDVYNVSLEYDTSILIHFKQ